MPQGHTFHIPVMGTGFTIDTPVKVAKYGIHSVISLVDDTLIEQMRQYYCGVIGEAYTPITKHDEDYRARRITAYLNLLDRIVKMEFAKVRSAAFEPNSEITKYFEMLPSRSRLKQEYKKMLSVTDPAAKRKMQENLRGQMKCGRIDVNIMTKLDRINFTPDKKELPPEFTDALAAFRGYAQSTLESAIVFSAGFNRHLYSYIEKFEDFYANASGFIKKKIILKVSDFRSSITQGKFLAKKGLWVSEYRVESGLNCGGHAFSSAGVLMGPILEEFKNKRKELVASLHELYNKALALSNRKTFDQPHPLTFTAQGGVGTTREHEMLLNTYDVDSVGWGTPFLLVPEAVNVDEETLRRLAAAGEEDLFLSGSSPLGIPFNNLRNATSEEEKRRRIAAGCPGSSCVKGHLAINTEFAGMPICTASREYQRQKTNNIDATVPDESKRKILKDLVMEKACICHELGNGVLLKLGIVKDPSKAPVAVCPGPNLAYFSKIVTLAEMIDHIYGRINLLNEKIRPHMYMKELQMNLDAFFAEVKLNCVLSDANRVKYLQEFRDNLQQGIAYYQHFFAQLAHDAESVRDQALEELRNFEARLDAFIAEHAELFPPVASVANCAV
ncbi:MAG: hypothetical protein HQL23_02255 [Candidatus Omnitrophica bacterium]|nr:hypothetical protein [Candidatus Omnitrophota bacterium]